MTLMVALVSLVGSTGLAAPKAVKQSPAMQAHFDDVAAIRAEVERLSLELQKLAAKEETKPVGQLVVEAANVATDAGSSAATVPATDTDSKFVAGIELRPSYYRTDVNTSGGAGGDKFQSENTLTVGVQFNKNTSFIYDQYVNTYGSGDLSVGYTPIVGEGAARVLLNNLWTSEKLGLALSYENRTLLPWAESLRDRNRVLANRNYIKLKKTFSDSFSVTLAETPIFFLHTTPNAIVGGLNKNNEAFENRFYVIPEASLLEGKLSIAMPMYIISTLRRDEEKFSHQLIAWPEVTYTVASGIDVGVAYYTGNLLQSNFDGFQIEKGLEDGVSQLVLRASL